MSSKRIKVIGTSALVGFGIGYGFNKFVMKGDNKAGIKTGGIIAGLAAAYGYFKTPSIEVHSNASGKKKKASPKKLTPESWHMDSNGKWHWVNAMGKITS